jgi:hypothetical protein
MGKVETRWRSPSFGRKSKLESIDEVEIKFITELL